jgi:hypothetical protein
MLATVRNGRDISKKTPKIKSDKGESPARKTKRPRDKDPKEKGQHRGKKHRGEDDTGKKKRIVGMWPASNQPVQPGQKTHSQEVQ